MLPDNARNTLLRVARSSIGQGLEHGMPLVPDPGIAAAQLREERATFVTVTKAEALRGCIGTLEAYRALISDVADNAYKAAFEDPRFPPLAVDEFDEIAIAISVLSPPEALTTPTRRSLLSQLAPGKDGLIIADSGRRATFLPKVWEQLVSPDQFVAELCLKAGLAQDHWSDTMQCWRYGAEDFSEDSSGEDVTLRT